MFRPVEAEGEGPELTFYQLTVIEERKKGAEKYKTSNSSKTTGNFTLVHVM